MLHARSGVRTDNSKPYSRKSLYSSRLGSIFYGNEENPVRGKCCDITIKPSNPQFFTQGAVSASSRVERLRYDVLFAKTRGSPYTTAWAQAANNAGRFRVDGNGPYFMKNKAVVCQPQNYARFNKVCGNNP